MNIYKNVKFEHLGYSLDYHVDGKYYGSKKIEEADREIIGYSGKKEDLATEDIIFKNKKIKKGMKYYTFLYPLCGKSNINLNIK